MMTKRREESVDTCIEWGERPVVTVMQQNGKFGATYARSEADHDAKRISQPTSANEQCVYTRSERRERMMNVDSTYRLSCHRIVAG